MNEKQLESTATNSVKVPSAEIHLFHLGWGKKKNIVCYLIFGKNITRHEHEN